MTIKEFLLLPKEDQSKLAGQLREKPWRHRIDVQDDRMLHAGVCCMKCGETLSSYRNI